MGDFALLFTKIYKSYKSLQKWTCNFYKNQLYQKKLYTVLGMGPESGFWKLQKKIMGPVCQTNFKRTLSRFLQKSTKVYKSGGYRVARMVESHFFCKSQPQYLWRRSVQILVVFRLSITKWQCWNDPSLKQLFSRPWSPGLI